VRDVIYAPRGLYGGMLIALQRVMSQRRRAQANVPDESYWCPRRRRASRRVRRTRGTGGEACNAVSSCYPHLRHCSSPASAVRRLPSAVRTATPAFHVRSSGLFCSRPGGLELVTRLPARSITFRWQFSPGPENFSFLVLLAYTANWRLCDYALYKSTIDTGLQCFDTIGWATGRASGL